MPQANYLFTPLLVFFHQQLLRRTSAHSFAGENTCNGKTPAMAKIPIL
jgi:hypothetical protein